MSKLSIKARITVWYTVFLVIVVACVLLFLFSMGDYQTKENAKSELMEAVSEAMKDIDFDDGDLETDDIDFLSHGMYLTVYDGLNTFLDGKMPKDFPANVAFSNQQMRTAGAMGNSWYVYDISKDIKGYGTVWVRGIAPLSPAESALGTMLRLALITLPFLVLLASVGGYQITRHAFLPVRKIVRTAARIGEGRDLSKRIGLPKEEDEIHDLAHTFDGMLDRLELSFEKEKQFTADASHELRTPTSVIIAQSEYAIEHPDAAQEALQVILQQARKTSALISQLLMLARSDRQSLQMETLNLSELMEMVVLQQREVAEEKGIRIDMDIEPGLSITGDETLLMRMMINLIDNAVKFGKQNIQVSLHRKDGRLAGCVADDGDGIPEAEQKRIWDRFYQVNPSRSGEGAGLGLSMVRWIVEAHHGQIDVASAPGKGSSFQFVFPA